MVSSLKTLTQEQYEKLFKKDLFSEIESTPPIWIHRHGNKPRTYMISGKIPEKRGKQYLEIGVDDILWRSLEGLDDTPYFMLSSFEGFVKKVGLELGFKPEDFKNISLELDEFKFYFFEAVRGYRKFLKANHPEFMKSNSIYFNVEKGYVDYETPDGIITYNT
ncbi:MAG: hypothetical protein PHT54_01800 [Candidatus Nanoarchaeia archaeon]|nr:hypothetical protein [Candidatus Nanoarchaeia archaeon]